MNFVRDILSFPTVALPPILLFWRHDWFEWNNVIKKTSRTSFFLAWEMMSKRNTFRKKDDASFMFFTTHNNNNYDVLWWFNEPRIQNLGIIVKRTRFSKLKANYRVYYNMFSKPPCRKNKKFFCLILYKVYRTFGMQVTVRQWQIIFFRRTFLPHYSAQPVQLFLCTETGRTIINKLHVRLHQLYKPGNNNNENSWRIIVGVWTHSMLKCEGSNFQ